MKMSKITGGQADKINIKLILPYNYAKSKQQRFLIKHQ